MRSNLVIVPVGADGKVDLRNALGSVHLIVDVQGWIPTSDAFTPVVPTRLLDTRSTVALTAGATVDVEIGRVAGVPALVSAQSSSTSPRSPPASAPG